MVDIAARARVSRQALGCVHSQLVAAAGAAAAAAAAVALPPPHLAAFPLLRCGRVCCRLLRRGSICGWLLAPLSRHTDSPSLPEVAWQGVLSCTSMLDFLQS